MSGAATHPNGTPNGVGELPLNFRKVEGPKCADCGAECGMVTINGHSHLVESRMVVTRGGALLLALHLCAVAPATSAPKRAPSGGRKR